MLANSNEHFNSLLNSNQHITTKFDLVTHYGGMKKFNFDYDYYNFVGIVKI